MNSSSQRPFSIRIFLPHGSPDGVRIVTKSNWTGCGIVCPRPLFTQAKSREEFYHTGVYVLIGPSEDVDLPTIYIGEGNPVRPRLEQHYANKDFWTWAVLFVSKDLSLNKAHVQYLEARLVDIAQNTRRAKLENHNSPQIPTLSEAETADAESFLADMLSIFPLLGLNAFESVPQADEHQSILQIQSKGITAHGHESAQGFVVLNDSEAIGKEVPSIHRYLSSLRQELINQDVLVLNSDRFVFAQDYVFNSPSTAAGVVLGRTANGRTEWKDDQGRELKQLQEDSTKMPED
ncbi:MAG: GIY-YIG nuclease family protein [Salinibacter sp.]